MVTEQLFANNFWGLKDDGYQALKLKMNNNKKTYEEIKSFYNIWATVHEEFGRKLMKHAKGGIGREELGTVHDLLKSAHEEMEKTAQAHIDLSHKIKSKLEVQLNNFVLEQKDKRKLTHINVEKAHRFKISTELYLTKVKEKYESDYAKLLSLQSQIETVTGREAQKVKQKLDRIQNDVKVQEQEYKNACDKSANATEAWNNTWKLACDTYQVMEKQRLEFIRHSFFMYNNMLSSTNKQDAECYERFWKSLDNFDADKDIQTFIQEKKTGPQIPKAEIFVDYLDDPTKTFQQYELANFSVPPELLNSPSLDESEETESDQPPTEKIQEDIMTPIEKIQEDPKPLPNPPPSTSDDVEIDPRANVVFSIGNNRFDLGQLQDSQPTLTRYGSERRLFQTRRRSSIDQKETSSFSYESLFEELGIFDKKKEKGTLIVDELDQKNVLQEKSNHSTSSIGGLQRRNTTKQYTTPSDYSYPHPSTIQQQNHNLVQPTPIQSHQTPMEYQHVQHTHPDNNHYPVYPTYSQHSQYQGYQYNAPYYSYPPYSTHQPTTLGDNIYTNNTTSYDHYYQ